jgi:hypothetical protein
MHGMDLRLPAINGPTDIPDLRDWLLRQYAPTGALRQLDGRWIETNTRNAAMWWVEPEACDVLDVSAPTWPADHLLSYQDPVTISGLAVFARDIEGHDASPNNEGVVVRVSALLWGPSMLPPTHGYPKGRPGTSVAMFRRLDLGEGLNSNELRLAGPQLGALVEVHGDPMLLNVPQMANGVLWAYLGRTDWTYGAGSDVMMPDNPYGTSEVTAASMAEDRRLLASLWQLTRTPVVRNTEHHLPRAAARRVERSGGDPKVRVLTLGGARPASTPGEHTTREWQHRWVVRPHWRRQPYGPGRTQHRTILVGPYMKGPDDKPFLGADRVYRIVAPRKDEQC